MITITWSTLIGIIVIVLLLAYLIFGDWEGGLDFRPVFIFIFLIVFIAIWGGIFWW